MTMNRFGEEWECGWREGQRSRLWQTQVLAFFFAQQSDRETTCHYMLSLESPNATFNTIYHLNYKLSHSILLYYINADSQKTENQFKKQNEIKQIKPYLKDSRSPVTTYPIALQELFQHGFQKIPLTVVIIFIASTFTEWSACAKGAFVPHTAAVFLFLHISVSEFIFVSLSSSSVFNSVSLSPQSHFLNSIDSLLLPSLSFVPLLWRSVPSNFLRENGNLNPFK